MRRLTQEEQIKISEVMNQAVNWFQMINETEDGMYVEVGYWITHEGCRPKYTKEVVYFTNIQLGINKEN